MAKFPVNSFVFLSGRSYAAVAENVGVQTATSARKKVVESSSAGDQAVEEQKEIFWMKDPKTGNWMPENRFGEIAVSDLREKYLSKKERV